MGIPLALSMRSRVDSEVRSQAESQAQIVAANASEVLEPKAGSKGSGALDRLVQVSAEHVRGRVIVVNRSGIVVADSAGRAEVGHNYSSRPEIQQALGGSTYQATRNSNTLGTALLATAVPVLHGSRTTGAVRVTQSVDAVNAAVHRSMVGVILLGGVVLLLGLAGGFVMASEIARPIRRLDRAAESVSTGDLEARATVEGSSEQRSLALSFNRMTERLAEMIRSQQDFVADASHQLRTPLAGLRLRLEELRETTASADDAAQLDAGMREVDRLSHIVDELLILSPGGEHGLPPEALDAEEALERAFERWAAHADEQGVELVVEPGAEGSFWCARADLDRALDPLIENAIVYSPAGAEVELAAGAGAIEVRDRGAGVDAGERDAVFQRFYRGGAGRRVTGGTGLGLPIALQFAEAWGGSVALLPRSGGGTVARLILPAPDRISTERGARR